MQNWVAMSDPAIVWEIGQRLRRVRLNRNRSQKWVAEQTGLSRVTISNLENGSVAVSLLNLVRVLRALNYLHLFEALPDEDAISPIKLAKLQAKTRRIASPEKPVSEPPPSEW